MINATGCAATAVIAVVVTCVKFIDGAWLVVLLIPTLVGLMLFIRRQYDHQTAELESATEGVHGPDREQRVVVPSTASTGPSSRP